jgi:hypothetical protein
LALTGWLCSCSDDDDGNDDNKAGEFVIVNESPVLQIGLSVAIFF